ncbi:MAG: sensor histidine kinase, partial [Candidatus Eisenbacteria sp.]|nr:sensor histidine kinase [Candidatus Eisenbacteria bacterium]
DSEGSGRSGKTGRDMRFAFGGRGILARTEEALFCLGLTRTPLDPWPIVLLGLGGLVCGAACVPGVRRASLASLRRALMPPSDRADAADELLDGLATAGHGKLAVTSTLRRLRKQTAMSSGLEGPAPAELQERWRGAVRDALEVGVTSLDGVVLMARRMGLAPSTVARLHADLDRARKLLRRAPERVPTGVDAAEFSERLEPLLESVENHLAELKASARRYVSAELVAELRRVTEAHRSDMLSAGVEFQAPAVTSIEGVRVFGTRLEVCFVLDNLLSNAIEAVRNAAQRRIELSMCRDGDRVSVMVSDTGVGIPEGLKEDVFKAGVSSRAGGGHGLPRSRELLKKRGGDIVLVRSTTGEGTEFMVHFEIV